MGNMHVLPTEADLRIWDGKMDPIKDFVGLKEDSEEWEHHCPFCNGCGEPFDAIFNRKHHCRICGLTFCTRCSPSRHLLSGERGCGKCLSELIIKVKDEMLAQHSSASPRTQAQRATFEEATAAYQKQQAALQQQQQEGLAQVSKAQDNERSKVVEAQSGQQAAEHAMSSDDASPLSAASPATTTTTTPPPSVIKPSNNEDDDDDNDDEDGAPLKHSSTEAALEDTSAL